MSNATTIEGVDVMVLRPSELISLTQTTDTFSSSGKDTVMVMKLSEADDNEQIIALFEATLSRVDTYVLYYPPNSTHVERNEPISTPNVEADSNYDLPRALQNRVHLDVPYEFGSSWQDALVKAWKRCQHGSRLIVVTDEFDLNQTLDTLRTSNANMRDRQDSISRAVELDQDSDRSVTE